MVYGDGNDRFVAKLTQRAHRDWDLDYYLAHFTLLWLGQVVRMPKSRLPRRLLTSWVGVARQALGQEMACGRSLEQWLKRFGIRLTFSDWAQLAQNKTE